ncbi:hypothetical protein PRIPAC_97741 [Pristionchus pacificus]|uniref:Uncharacterized protein n=1 Tax=Pristionchus pacificus TaxID=54126 RepID=A0A454XQP8_PRIPA|nr:hypothetical protein PRIPAC_97741 [Pristionchus pacificus]|eukprot:PDM81641.1 hypothetical protein PRIPAC_30622 [Pristionchus pacificus]
MCTPFAMHWFISTTPDWVSFECFGCRKVGKFNCFSLACTNDPDIHLFCPDCAQYHDTRLNFSCPACLLRDEVDNCKAEAAKRLIANTPLLTVSHLRECRITSKEAEEKIEKKMKYEEEEKDYVLIDMNDVEYQK